MIDLVTGATGFIGSHLAERLLREGRKVRVLCRAGSEHKLTPHVAAGAEIARGDLRDRASLLAATCGAARVFHCAGHVLDWGAERDFVETNVRGTEWLLEGARVARVARVVHFSSIAVFGTPSPPRFDDESPPGTSRDLYSRTKVESERIARRFADEGLAITILRPAVVYGPRGRWLEEPLERIERGSMFLLGGGAGTCHPCYIENLLDATLLAADHARAVGQAFIVADDDPISFRTYFDGVAAIGGRPPVRRSISLPVARAIASALELGARATRSRERPLLTHAALDMVSTKSQLSMEKIKRELGFRPRHDFASAVEELRAHRAPRHGYEESSNATLIAEAPPFERAVRKASL
jgi:nucleoside-diphosphate-sugar epimerase